MAQTIALTVLAQEYAHDLIPTVNRTCIALRTLPMRVGGGKNCGWVIKGSGATAAVMAEGAAAGTPANDAQLPAVLNWAYYKADGGATGPAQAAAATAGSPRGNANLLAMNVVDSVAQLASEINQDVYSGDPTASPVEVGGFDYALGSVTNTYATINRTSEAAARPTIFNPGVATPVTHAMLRKDISDIKVASGEAPNLALCHPDVFNEIAGTFDATRRYNQTTEFTNERGLIKLDASVNAVTISGCTFVEDKDATRESGNTSGRIYYLNTRFVEFELLPPKEIAGLLAQMGIVPGMLLRANDGFGEIPLLAAVVSMAKTGDADTFMAKAYLQLKIKSPKHCGMRRFVQINS
ncbi:hypothetical protein [Caudoviricetes sp.]|nr:hypothetical protein [Caudoviricetes sp.]